MGSSPMEKIGECNGVTLYFADNSFKYPGVYYWDGTDNVRAWPPDETATQTEIKALHAELARIEEQGTPWVPELLEWLEKHHCCPPLPFTDYELIEALESRFGAPNPPQPSASVDERARELFEAMLSAPYGNTTMGDIVCAETTRNRLESAWLPIIASALTTAAAGGGEVGNG